MNAPAIDIALYQSKIDAMGLIPRKDTLTGLVAAWVADGPGWTEGRTDASLAPLMVQALQYVYTQVYETKYPQFAAANGDVLKIDTRVPHTATSYTWHSIDFAGYASWIGDDGTVAPSSSAKATPHVGFLAEAGHKFGFTVRELERAAAAGVPLPTYSQNNAKKVHDAKRNWTWLFGSPEKKIAGLCNHPNIQIAVAPSNAAASFGDARDRLIENKTNDEILADIETIVETIPRSTIRAHFVAKVFMPYRDMQTLRRRRLGAGDGTLSLWDYIQSNYGTASKTHPAVSFEALNECAPEFRVNPEPPGTDTSGIRGRFWLAIPDATLDELAFIMAKPFAQDAPQQVDRKISTLTSETFGGCKCQIPVAVLRLDFLAQDNATTPA